MKNALLFLAFLIVLSAQQYAQTPYVNWAESGGGTQSDRGQALHTDARGYSAVGGSFNGSITMNSINLSGGSGQSGFIAVYDSVGTIQWARANTGTGTATVLGITRDGSGNILATGYFTGSITWGTTALSSSGSEDIFVVKYSSSGTFLWAIKAGGSSIDQGFAISADASGNVYVTGYITGAVSFGALNTTASFYDAFLVKYNASGVEQWLQKGGGSSTDYGRGVAVDASGNVYLAGDIYGTGNCTFGTVTVNGAGAYDAFIAKYNNAGTIQWVRTGGGALNDRFTAASVDPSGNVLVTGFTSGNVSFSSNNLTPIGDQDIVIAKYTPTGTLSWIRQAGGALSYNAGYAICSDATGNVYVSGTFQNTISFGSLSMQSLGLDPFVARYTSGGSPVWIQRAGAGLDDEGKGIGVDTSGRTYFTGWFNGNATPFGVHTLVSAGQEDIFMARLDSGVITLNPVITTYCAGDSIFIPYQAFGDFQPLNFFVAELSNATGSFSAPVVLGQLSGQQSSTVAGRIPVGTAAGTGYRVRVNGTLIAATGRMNTVNLTIKSLPATPVPSVSGTACAGAALQLTVNSIAGASWNWSGPNAFTSSLSGPVINPASTLNSGVYSVSATVNGCTGSEGTVNVSVIHLPGSVSPGNSGPICSGNTLSLSVSTQTGFSYFWQGPGGFSSALQNPNIPNAQPSNGGVYSLQVYASGCSTQVSTTTATVNTTPVAPTASAQQVVLCAGDTLYLNASTVTGASYNWSGPSGFASTLQNPSIPAVTTSQGGIYSVFTFVGICSSAVSTVNIQVNAGPPSVMAGSNSPVCENSSLNFMAGNITGGTYVWNGPNGFTSNLQNPVINPVTLAASGVYTLVVSNGCASSQSLVTVNILSGPSSPIASSNSPVCVGGTITLKASTVTNAVYFWQGPNSFTSTTQNPIIQPAALIDSGIYSVYAVLNGCSSQVSITQVVVLTGLNTPVLSSNTACVGQTLNFTCQDTGVTYHWDGPGGWTSSQQNPSFPSASTTLNGIYSCYITNSGGCISPIGTLTVNVLPPSPTAVISQSGDTLYSSVPTGNQWYDSNGPISGATQDWFVPGVSGVYYVLVNQNGCPSDTSQLFTYTSLMVDQEKWGERIFLFPNPAKTYVRISIPEGLELLGSPELYDLQGRIVSELVSDGGERFSILGDIAPAVYYLIIHTNQGEVHKRLVIE